MIIAPTGSTIGSLHRLFKQGALDPLQYVWVLYPIMGTAKLGLAVEQRDVVENWVFPLTFRSDDNGIEDAGKFLQRLFGEDIDIVLDFPETGIEPAWFNTGRWPDTL